MYGYDYEPKERSIFLNLKNKGDQIKIRLVSIPIHFEDEYADKKFENFAWKVIDRNSGEVKAFKGGVTIYKKIKEFALNEEYGDPQNYDLTVTRTEEDGDNYFTVEPSEEKSPITDEEKELVANSNCDLKKLFNISIDKGTSTFGGGDGQVEEEVNLDDIPF